MTARLPSRWRIFSMTVIGALFWSLSFMVSAQSSGLNTGFTLDFLKSTEIASADEVVSNVVKAVNGTSRPIRFSIDVASPAGWRIVNNLNKLFTVNPSDSIFVPIRLIPSRETTGNVNYFISATAYSEFGNALASTPWTLEIKKISSWKLKVSERQVVFPNNADSATVYVGFENNGNSVEKLRMTMSPDSKLLVYDGNWDPLKDNSMLVELPVGVDTTFALNVKIQTTREKGYFFTDRPDDPNNDQEKRLYRLQIQATNTTEKNQVSGRRVDFLKLAQEVKFDSERGNSTIPLTIDFNAFNVLSNFTNFTLEARGETDLGSNRHLRYNYQAIITSNLISGTDVLPSNQFIQYSSPKLLVAAGNIGENFGILMNGHGAKATKRLGNFELGAIYVTSANRPGRLAVNDLNFYGGKMGYYLPKNSKLEFQYVNQVDNFNSKDGNLYRLKMDYNLGRSHRLGVTAGYSTEQDTFDPDSVFTQNGYGLELRYGGSVGRMNIGLAGTYNSDAFLTFIRGTKSANLNFRYPVGKKKYLSLRAALNETAPQIFQRGFVFRGDVQGRQQYQLQYEWRGKGGTFTLYPMYLKEEILNLRIETTGGGMIYSSNRGKDTRIYTKFFVGMSTMPNEPNVDPFPVVRWENRIKYKNLNVLARYNYGPASVTENFRVVNDRLNPQSLFISSYANLYFRKIGLQLRPRINTSYESVLARWRVTASQDLSYYSKDGYVFTIGTELLTINQGESPLADVTANRGFEGVFNTFNQSNFFLTLGVKKEFRFRRPGNKHYNMKVAIFKDLDGNGVRDKGEEFAENVLIKVKGKWAITGKEGIVTFSNLPIGNYIVESEVLGGSEGWFNMDATPVLLDKDQTVYIPLSKGVQISGQVIVQKATYSAYIDDVSLESIRVSAVGPNDRVFSSMTDKSGRFVLYVPFGKYDIKASSAGVDDQLQFAQDTYPLEINNANANYQLTFYLIEKSRRLNIKKFNNN